MTDPRRLLVFALSVGMLFGACQHASVLDGAAELTTPPESYAVAEALSGDGAAEAICAQVGDAELADLQRRLGDSSLDLRAAVARLDAAEARAREAGATLRPRVDAQLQVTRSSSGAFAFPIGQTVGGQAGGSGEGGSGASTTYQPSVAASYEIDAWGRLRHRKAAAVLEAEASAEDVRTLAISLASRLAELWFGIVAERELIALLDDQRRTSQSFLELTTLRFGQGLGPAQDIGRQKEQLLGLEGQIELAEGRLQSLEVQLATLLGSTDPSSPASRASLADQIARAGLPELGLPAELVGGRPDLVAAQRRLEAADRRLAAAVKEWLPGLSLTASLFDFRNTIGELFKDLLWQIVGQASENVTDGGGRRARIDQARAAAEENLYAYAQALVAAVGEVQIAVALDRNQADFLVNLQLRLEEARRVLELTRESYREGATDYLNVLTALRSQQSLEQQLIDARRQQLLNRVQLCRALGHPTGARLDPLVAAPTAASDALSEPIASSNPLPNRDPRRAQPAPTPQRSAPAAHP